MTIEGVTYFRFRVTFRTSDRKRRRWVRWSPGAPWIFDEVRRELEATFTRAESSRRVPMCMWR